jgi:nucleoside-diphosphate kinase
VGRNIIHGSDGPESAAKEITYWFAESEIANWSPSQSAWLYE